MDGFLFVVEPDESIFVGRVASLECCETEGDVHSLMEYWQTRVGDDFVILDSRHRPEWLASTRAGLRKNVVVSSRDKLTLLPFEHEIGTSRDKLSGRIFVALLATTVMLAFSTLVA